MLQAKRHLQLYSEAKPVTIRIATIYVLFTTSLQSAGLVPAIRLPVGLNRKPGGS